MRLHESLHWRSMDGLRLVVQILALAQWVVLSTAHGRLVEPPNRGSVWRLGYRVPKNYDDNSLNCGGFQVQWLVNGGRCGLCGDPYNGPRRHEKDGIFASDVITRTYRSGDVINVTIAISANHGGAFSFYLCPDTKLSMSCFNSYPLYVVDEGYRHKLTSLKSPLTEHVQVQLPDDVSCSHCVLQWRWNCAQSYGMDYDTGMYCKGCGHQEQFWNCADIAIESDDENQGSSRETSKSIVRHRQSQHQTVRHHQSQRQTVRHRQSRRRTKSKPEESDTDLEDRTQFHGDEPAVIQRCVGSVTYGAILDSWCEVNCKAGFCPSTHCRCT